MMNFKDAYDKCVHENQQLRDSLIKCKRELESVRKNGIMQGQTMPKKTVQLGCGCLSFDNSPRAVWLLSSEDIGVISQLRADDLLISEDAEKLGNLVSGMPVCSPEALRNLTPRPFVWVYGNNYSKAKTRLQSMGYREFIEFESLNRLYNTGEVKVCTEKTKTYNHEDLIEKTKRYERNGYRNVEQDREYLLQRRYVAPYLDELKKLTRMGEADLEYWYDKLRDPLRLDICRLVVVLGTKCSLRCRDCNNLMPLFRPQQDIDLNVLKSSLQRFFILADSVVRVELIGGEPFLSGNLEEALRFVLSQSQIRQVELTTNATVLPKDEIVPLLQHKKVLVRISDYGTLVKKDRMIDFLNQHGIHYQLLKMGHWLSSGGTEARSLSKEELTKGYFRCTPGYICTTLYNGKLYECARSASLHAIGAMQGEELSIDTAVTKKDIREFLLKPYSMACDHCDMVLERPKSVPPAVQLGKREL